MIRVTSLPVHIRFPIVTFVNHISLALRAKLTSSSALSNCSTIMSSLNDNLHTLDTFPSGHTKSECKSASLCRVAIVYFNSSRWANEVAFVVSPASSDVDVKAFTFATPVLGRRKMK